MQNLYIKFLKSILKLLYLQKFFLEAWNHKTQTPVGIVVITFQPYQCSGFAYSPAFALKPKSINRLLLSFSVTPSLIKEVQEYKPVVHRLHFSASPQFLTNPGKTNFTLEPLVDRWVGFSPTLRYSHRHSHFLALQQSSRSTFSALRTLPYHLCKHKSIASVIRFSPGTSSAQCHSTSELLRTL